MKIYQVGDLKEESSSKWQKNKTKLKTKKTLTIGWDLVQEAVKIIGEIPLRREPSRPWRGTSRWSWPSSVFFLYEHFTYHISVTSDKCW